jgi:hypothetical protein
MKNSFIRALAVFILLIFGPKANSQYAWYYQWGLLPDSTINYFIGESSGERAYNHIAELSEYNRQRKPAEYSGTLMESQYVVDKLKEYGLSEVKIERLGKINSWHGITGASRRLPTLMTCRFLLQQ